MESFLWFDMTSPSFTTENHNLSLYLSDGEDVRHMCEKILNLMPFSFLQSHIFSYSTPLFSYPSFSYIFYSSKILRIIHFFIIQTNVTEKSNLYLSFLSLISFLNRNSFSSYLFWVISFHFSYYNFFSFIFLKWFPLNSKWSSHSSKIQISYMKNHIFYIKE